MPGLLDNPDGLMASPTFRIGLGLLSGAGQSSNFGQILQGAMQGSDAYADTQIKRKMALLQEQRAQQLFDMQKDAFAGIPGGQSGSAPGASMGSPGSSMGGSNMPAQISGGGGDTNAQLVRLEKMAIAGVPGAKEAFEIYKYRNDPQQLQPGTFSQNRVTGAREYIPDVKTGMGYGPNGITMLPGAENIAALEGAKTAATEGAKAQFDLVDVPRLNPDTGRTEMVKMPRAQAIRALGGGQQQSSDVPGRGLDLSRVSGDQLRQLMQEDPQAVAAGVQRFKQPSQGQFGVTPNALDSEVDKTKTLDPLNAQAAFNKGRAENMVKYEDGLNGRVQQGADLNMRLQESLKAMDNFTNGGGKETRAMLAQKAQAFGASPSIVNGIAGGDLASMQEFNKLAVQQAMEQLKQSMGGAGRIAQAEFKVFQANNPNLDTDANAVRKIYDFNTRVFNRDLDEQKAFNSHIDSGGNPASFPMLWTSQMAKQGYTNPSLSANPNPTPAEAKNAPAKVVSLADIQATARASGKTTKEVTDAAKAKGYSIGGM